MSKAEEKLEAVLDALHVKGLPWMTTRQVHGSSPWHLGTTRFHLRAGMALGLVEAGNGYPHPVWRLARKKKLYSNGDLGVM